MILETLLKAVSFLILFFISVVSTETVGQKCKKIKKAIKDYNINCEKSEIDDGICVLKIQFQNRKIRRNFGKHVNF